MYYRCSNAAIGLLNLLTLLSSIPIIGGGLWMAKSKTSCETFLQTPLLIIGFFILILSLAGFIGSCFDVAWVLWLYLAFMFLLISAFAAVTVFGFVVTSRGGGAQVPGRVYREYHLESYSPWLRKRLEDPTDWETIRACILGSKTCAKIASWTPLDYLQNNLSPIQSGCCKPPTACSYSMDAATLKQDPDCNKWNNAPNILCYECDSCKAGVLETMRADWRKLSILNIVMVILLIAILSIGCSAYRNTKGHHPHAPNKGGPGHQFNWWRSRFCSR